MKLSVVIVNYNVEYFLEQCLHSVRRAMQGIEGEVVTMRVKKVMAAVRQKFRALIEARERTRKFSKPNTCFFARKYSSILQRPKYVLATAMTSAFEAIGLLVTSIIGCSVIP